MWQFLVEHIFENIYLTVPAVTFTVFFYFLFVYRTYIQFISVLDLIPHYEQLARTHYDWCIFWLPEGRVKMWIRLHIMKEWLYIVRSMLWPVDVITEFASDIFYRKVLGLEKELNEMEFDIFEDMYNEMKREAEKENDDDENEEQ